MEGFSLDPNHEFSPVQRCYNCIFFGKRTMLLGNCRRHAPQPVLYRGKTDNEAENLFFTKILEKPTDVFHEREQISMRDDYGAMAAWPVTKIYDWCGEWKEREKAEFQKKLDKELAEFEAENPDLNF